MHNISAHNPTIPLFLRLVTLVECLVVFVAAAGLFFLPGLGRELWAWEVPPYNARYVGAIYFAALLPLVIFAASGRWSPGRVVLWMIFIFTLTIAIVMLLHTHSFAWDRVATYGFWFLYLFLPLNSAIFLVALRRLRAAAIVPSPLALRALLILLAPALLLHGLALLAAPALVTAFWPWPIDAFHGRIYAATFLTPAVGALVMLGRSAPAERLTLGLTLIILGVMSVAGVVWTSLTVPPAAKVDYSSLGTWAFFLMNGLIGLAGLLVAASAALRPRA